MPSTTFRRFSERTGAPLLCGLKTSHLAHSFLSEKHFPQVFCPRSLQAFGSPKQHQLTPLPCNLRVQLLSSHPRSRLPAHLVALLVCHFRELLEKFVRRHLAHQIRSSHSEYVHAPLASKSCHVQAVQHSLVVGFELSCLIIDFTLRASFSHLPMVLVLQDQVLFADTCTWVWGSTLSQPCET